MAGTGDRQKLRESLHDSKKYCLYKLQHARTMTERRADG